jgi:hypothetical protein
MLGQQRGVGVIGAPLSTPDSSAGERIEPKRRLLFLTRILRLVALLSHSQDGDRLEDASPAVGLMGDIFFGPSTRGHAQYEQAADLQDAIVSKQWAGKEDPVELCLQIGPVFRPVIVAPSADEMLTMRPYFCATI